MWGFVHGVKSCIHLTPPAPSRAPEQSLEPRFSCGSTNWHFTTTSFIRRFSARHLHHLNGLEELIILKCRMTTEIENSGSYFYFNFSPVYAYGAPLTQCVTTIHTVITQCQKRGHNKVWEGYEVSKIRGWLKSPAITTHYEWPLTHSLWVTTHSLWVILTMSDTHYTHSVTLGNRLSLCHITITGLLTPY